MLIGRLQTAAGPRWVQHTPSGNVVIADPVTGAEPPEYGELITGELLPPVDPLVVIGLAQNGPDADEPVQAWLKNPRTVVASGTPVVLRRDAGQTVAEAEIAVVIGRDGAGLTAANAHEYVLGITAVNDLSSPDRAMIDPRNFEGKSGVGYTPLGPWIDTAASIDTVPVSLRLDGVVVASDAASTLPVSVRDALVYLASWTQLGPGDVIMTGAPRTGRDIVPGMLVSVTVGDVTLVTETR